MNRHGSQSHQTPHAGGHPVLKHLTKQGLQQLRHGHPWVFGSQVSENPSKSAGLWHLGEHWFFFSPRSEIRLRRFGPSLRLWNAPGSGDSSWIGTPEEFEARLGGTIHDLLMASLRRRIRLFPGEKCFRWIFSECDLIPGLVVDRFDSKLVVQIQTAPIELFWPVIRKSLARVFSLELGIEPEIIELRNSSIRAKEGLIVEKADEALGDDIVSQIPEEIFDWNGLKWHLRPGSGQKTGAFLDQRDNHWAAVRWAQDLQLKEAWDLFCFEGGFGLHLAHAGLKVEAVDESKSALLTARRNAQLNELTEENFQTIEADVFWMIREKARLGLQTDLIVLDPPSMTRSKQNRDDALRGFKELNLRALKCLRPSSLLVTCSCSGAISREDFERMLREAAHDARRQVRVLEARGPSADHAPLLGFPESEYLQAWYLGVE